MPDEILLNSVDNFVDPNGNWHWESFDHLLPISIIFIIATTHPPMGGWGRVMIFFLGQVEKGGFFLLARLMLPLAQKIIMLRIHIRALL